MDVETPDFPDYDVIDSAALDALIACGSALATVDGVPIHPIAATNDRQRQILSEPSLPVDASDFSTDELHGLIRRLRSLVEREHGYGLSAVQIGFPARVFVLGINAGAGVFCNPAIVSHGRDAEMEVEACLSFPGYMRPIRRWRVITASWQDETGRSHRERLSGIRARAFQHELDHLDGITILDDAAGVREDS